MRRSYQRRPRIAVAVLAAALGSCSPPPAAPPRPAAELDDPALLLDTVAHELVAVGGPFALADRIGTGGVEAVALPLTGGPPRPLAAGRAGESRVVAAAGGRQVLELAPADGSPPELVVREPGGALVPLPPPRPVAERFVGWLRDGAALATAGARAAGEPESLYEIDPVGRSRRELARGEPGFAAAAVDAEARFVAWVRPLHDEADEVVILDRPRDESRLVLPTRADGRFAPQALSTDGVLLVVAGDASDLPRLERLDLASGRRQIVAAPPCAVASARSVGPGVVARALCDGRRELLRLDAGGVPVAPPPTATGTRPVAVAVGPDGGVAAVGVAGPTWPPEVVAIDPHGLPEPLTYGLAPRLSPAALPVPEPLAVRAGGVELPCELWRAPAPRSGIAWFEDDRRPPRFGELEPLAAALAGRGIAVLRCRGRGSDGFGRGLRTAADGDRAGAALADFDAAIGALRARLPPAAPLAVAGVGGWRAAAALAFAGRATTGVELAVALFPAADPLAALDAVAIAGEPARSRGLAAWGDPESAERSRERIAWAAAIETVRTPALVVTGHRPQPGELAAERVTAAAAGAPVEHLLADRSRLDGRLLAPAARELFARLVGRLANDAGTPPKRR